MSGRTTALGILFAMLATSGGCGRGEPPAGKPTVFTPWQPASTMRGDGRGSDETPPWFHAQAFAAPAEPLGGNTRWPRTAMLRLYGPDCVGDFSGVFGVLRDPPSGGATERSLILERLRKDLNRDTSVGSALVHFAADRRVPWARIDRWLAELRMGPLDVETVALRGRMLVRLSPVLGRKEPDIHVETIAGAEGPFVRIRDGTTVYDFPAGAPYDGEARLAVANRHWAALFARLEASAAHGATTLALSIDAAAPWSHVLQLLSLAAAAGIAAVSVEGSKVSMRFSTLPSDLSSIPPPDPIASGRPFDRPAWTFLAIGVAAAVGVGALLRRGPGPRSAPGR